MEGLSEKLEEYNKKVS